MFLTAENAEEGAEDAEVLMIACCIVGLCCFNCQLSIVNDDFVKVGVFLTAENAELFRIACCIVGLC